LEKGGEISNFAISVGGEGKNPPLPISVEVKPLSESIIRLVSQDIGEKWEFDFSKNIPEEKIHAKVLQLFEYQNPSKKKKL
jgi:hypothetical protein